MKLKLTAIILFLGFFNLKAQEGLPVYFDYLSDNYYLIHPAMAGVNYGTKIRLTARKQWFDVDNAPNLQTINAHTRLGDKNGLGMIIYNDKNGYHAQTGAKLTYAYHLQMGGDARSLNQLSFGLSGTLIQSSLDETDFVSLIPDPAISGGKLTSSYYNMDLGLSYNYLEFYAHLTLMNALSTERTLYYKDRDNNPNATLIDNLRRLLVSVGYVFDSGDWQWEPSLLFQLTDFTKEKTLDMNVKGYRAMEFGTLWGGLSYRRSFGGAEFNSNGTIQSQKLQLISPILGVNYKNFMFAYTYSYQAGNIKFDNGGFHQITIGYDFGQREKRYDCKCPAVNF